MNTSLVDSSRHSSHNHTFSPTLGASAHQFLNRVDVQREPPRLTILAVALNISAVFKRLWTVQPCCDTWRRDRCVSMLCMTEDAGAGVLYAAILCPLSTEIGEC